MVLWLLGQCGRPQTECRHKCLELFYEFVPLLPGEMKKHRLEIFFRSVVLYFYDVNLGKKSPPQWLEGVLKDRGMAFLVAKFEGGGLLSQPTLRNVMGPFSVRATLQWMDLLLAALDCYNTFIGLHIIRPNHMLGKFSLSPEQSVQVFIV